jgi:hypothetical protein
MKIPHALATLSLFSALLTAPLLGCNRVPASSDPQGKDLVEGAVVTAEESIGGYRLYKILHVDDNPEPFGTEYHLVAYDPKAETLEQSAQIFRQGNLQVALDHFEVQKAPFLKRNHRVLAVEPVTDAERAPYIKSRDSRK